MSQRALPRTDHTYLGQPIIIGKKPGRPKLNRKKAGWYSINDKTRAACLYAVMADYNEVSKITEIPASELRSMAGEQWWQDVIKEVRKEENDSMSSQLTKIANTTFEKIVERLQVGDPVLNHKTGEISFLPIRFRDLANSLGSLIDKRQLLRGDPTTRTDKLGQDEILKLLGDKFESFAKKLTKKEDPVTIETLDYVEVKNDNLSKVHEAKSQATQASSSPQA